jgi:dolichol-phosphate mannosyltransferase
MALLQQIPSISIIVPTYREAENIAVLIDRIKQLIESKDLNVEMIIVDDDSDDGIDAIVEKLGQPWVKLLIRKEATKGLSESVLDGLKIARNDVTVVMDADLSHPPEAIPQMLYALLAGVQMCVGSRYVTGGSTSDDWGILRWLNSRIATCLSRPLTDLKDPMSGFFAVWRSAIKIDELRPTGYKIGLEILVKSDFTHVSEVPIHFNDRVAGESKLTLKEQVRFLRHLRRLYIYRARFWTDLIQFAAVGVSGVIVNLIVVSVLVALSMPSTPSILAGIFVSFCSNFLLNRSITFRGHSEKTFWQQLLGFGCACSIGALLNFCVAYYMIRLLPNCPIQLAAITGIGAGFIVNFILNRYHIFKETRYIKEKT